MKQLSSINDLCTGLYYFRARWYDSETGRWLSKDRLDYIRRV